MASTVCQVPAVDYFTATTKRPQINNITTYDWDSSPYSDPTLVNSDSCDSLLSSPTSPSSIVFPQPSYALPKDEINPTIKTEETFNFGTFEDWMRWDDPSDAALSPTSDFFPEFKLEPTSPSMGGLELQGSGIGSNNTNSFTDESAVFGEDPTIEEPLFQTPSSLITPPLNEIPRENLYSTPLSWSRPSISQQRSSTYTGLTPQEEAKLRNIAMPPQSQQNQWPASPDSDSSPEPSENNRRKRKSSVEDDDEEDSPPPSNGRHPPVKKTAHNMIEKRYRTNLNDKIAALRDSVPSLRVMSKKNARGEEAVHEDLQGLTPAHKLNKATVLSKATEYISHLEKRNKYLVKENAALKSRVDAFEILVMARQPQNQQSQAQKAQQQQIQQQQRNSMSRQAGMPQRNYSIDGMM